jgi:hypothetical protein
VGAPRHLGRRRRDDRSPPAVAWICPPGRRGGLHRRRRDGRDASRLRAGVLASRDLLRPNAPSRYARAPVEIDEVRVVRARRQRRRAIGPAGIVRRVGVTCHGGRLHGDRHVRHDGSVRRRRTRVEDARSIDNHRAGRRRRRFVNRCVRGRFGPGVGLSLRQAGRDLGCEEDRGRRKPPLSQHHAHPTARRRTCASLSDLTWRRVEPRRHPVSQIDARASCDSLRAWKRALTRFGFPVRCSWAPLAGRRRRFPRRRCRMRRPMTASSR